MRWKTILVPHDFSSCANHATALARDVAKMHGSSLVLLHVTELPKTLGPDTIITPGEGAPMSIQDYAMASARAHLVDLEDRLRRDGVEVRSIASLGKVDVVILAAAAQEEADLIVMGTHGRTGLEHLLVGSVTEKVIRAATVPVLTVRAGGEAHQTRAEARISDSRDG
jgi:nucleotide-binding universal stress UspA family protein